MVRSHPRWAKPRDNFTSEEKISRARGRFIHRGVKIRATQFPPNE